MRSFVVCVCGGGGGGGGGLHWCQPCSQDFIVMVENASFGWLDHTEP